jgi:hypothetical protein
MQEKVDFFVVVYAVLLTGTLKGAARFAPDGG